jgi:hypothetical protein
MKSQEWIFKVDKLTASLEEVSTGRSYSTSVYALERSELPLVIKKNGWKFNWREEFAYDVKTVYKLIANDFPDEIQGLISLSDAGDHIFMPLVETAPHNFGRNKKFHGVLGNLVAFACKLSFEKGHDGEVGFIAKTALIPHYEKELGAKSLMGTRMGIFKAEAKKLVSCILQRFLLMITQKSLHSLDSVGYLGKQKKMAKKEYLLELKKSSEALRLYKSKHFPSKKAT